MGLIIFIVVVVLLVLWIVSVYNGLVKERMKVKNSGFWKEFVLLSF